jgi:hypothetical protein
MLALQVIQARAWCESDLPPWIKLPFNIRWNEEPFKLVSLPPSAVHNLMKFSVVLGATSSRSLSERAHSQRKKSSGNNRCAQRNGFQPDVVGVLEQFG